MKYWIFTTYAECPVCGREDVIKERIYHKPKPIEYGARNEFTERYDYCLE